MEQNHRKQHRFQLSWPLQVRVGKQRRGPGRPAGMPVISEETLTENISTKGCYFLLSRKPVVGLDTEMVLYVPGQPAGSPCSAVRCRGKVVRVDDGGVPGKVGVACSIEHFSFAALPRGRDRALLLSGKSPEGRRWLPYAR